MMDNRKVNRLGDFISLPLNFKTFRRITGRNPRAEGGWYTNFGILTMAIVPNPIESRKKNPKIGIVENH